MATEEELLQARDNALNAGRKDDARKLTNILAKRQGLPSRESIRAPLKDFVFEQDPEEGGVTTALKSGAAGFANSYAKPLYGAADALGLGNVVDLEGKLAGTQAVQDRSPVGAGAELVGDIAKYALPGTAAYKAAKIPQLAKGATAAVGLAGEVLGAGAIKGLETPGEDQTRLGNAASEGGYAAAGMLGGEVLKRTLKGVNLKEGARKYLDEGGYMTPGQAAKRQSIGYLESIMGVFPLTARKTKVLQDKAIEEYSPHVVQKLTQGLKHGESSVLKKTGQKATQKAMKEMGETVDGLYDDAWKSVDGADWAQRGSGDFKEQLAQKAGLFSTPEETGVFKRIGLAVDDSIGQVDTKIRNAMENAEGDFLEALGELRVSLRQHAGPEVVGKLKHVDSFYPEVLAARKAASKKDFGAFAPKEHARATRMVGGARRAAEGTAPGQQAAEELSAAFEPQSIGMMANLGRVSRVNPINIPYMEALGNVVTGNTNAGRRVRANDEDLINMLRMFGGATGAAIGDQE